LFDCKLFSLTNVQRQTCWQRKLKVVDGNLIPVSFGDKFGANAEKLRKYDTEDAVLNAQRDDNHEIFAKTLSLSKTLPRTVTNTGTGLYQVKKSPVNESEVQNGGVSGQVVTIDGTIAASPAFLGGYVTNTTRSQTRAIVSHTTTTVTLEGVITSWLDDDVLQFYDSWGTVDAAGDQLVVDQGTTDYPAPQEIRVYAGTYTESINIGTMEPTGQNRLKFTVNGSDSVTFSNTALGTDLLELNDSECVEIHDIIFNTVSNYSISADSRGPWWLYGCTFQGGSGGIVRDIFCIDCTFDTLGYAFRHSQSRFERCTFIDLTYGTNWTMAPTRMELVACVFTGCTACMHARRDQSTSIVGEYQLSIINCTFYDCTKVYDMTAVTDCNAFQLEVLNSIFHTCTTLWYGNDAEAALVAQNCNYNTYYNCTQIARLGGANVSFASWQALTDHNGTSPDANSLTSDPGLTDAAGADFSLTAASNCRHAGIGSYVGVKTGHNGVDFDKFHPDKGAWSSGAGPNVASGG
jgi:hypothetical protein